MGGLGSLRFGMQVQLFVPGRSSIHWPFEPFSTILAFAAMSGGPADIASAIFSAAECVFEAEAFPAIMVPCADAAVVRPRARTGTRKIVRRVIMTPPEIAGGRRYRRLGSLEGLIVQLHTGIDV